MNALCMGNALRSLATRFKQPQPVKLENIAVPQHAAASEMSVPLLARDCGEPCKGFNTHL